MSDNIQLPGNQSRYQNRVPTQTELDTLRSMLCNNRQLIATIGNQVGVAKDAHGRIQTRYDQLLRELEGVKSELEASHSYLAMLKKQEEDLRAKDQELQVLLHPIRRCPEDILALAFELVVDENTDGRLKRATALSSVCRSWRALALRTGRLWAQVVVSMQDDTQDLESFSNRTRARLRSIPADVTIKDIKNRYCDSFRKALQLYKFKSIEKLRYLLRTTNDLDALEGLVPRAISDSVKTVGIEVAVYDEAAFEWYCGRFFNAFPALRSLSLTRTGWHTLEGLNSLNSLRCITLNQVPMSELTLDLPKLSRLEELEIKDDPFELEDLKEDVSLPLLHTLTILDVKNFPWKRFSALRLRKLVADDRSEDMIDFCCRHLSLRELALKTFIGNGKFSRISSALAELKTLETIGSFNSFLPKGGTETPFPPFPKLHHLTIELDGMEYTGYDTMDSFLRSRSIPLSSAQNTHGLGMLECLEIIDFNNRLEDAEWRDHPLLQNCTQTMTETEYECERLQLRWIN